MSLTHDIAPDVDEKDVMPPQHEESKDILRQEADRAEEFEHQLSTWQSVKAYRAVGG